MRIILIKIHTAESIVAAVTADIIIRKTETVVSIGLKADSNTNNRQIIAKKAGCVLFSLSFFEKKRIKKLKNETGIKQIMKLIIIIVLLFVVGVIVFKCVDGADSKKTNKTAQKGSASSAASTKPKAQASASSSTSKSSSSNNVQMGSDEWFFEMIYLTKFGLESSSKAFAEHPLGIAELDIKIKENQVLLNALAISTGEILRDIAPSGMAHGILAVVLRFDENVISKLKKNVTGLNRKISIADMTFGDFLKQYDCKTYGEVAALQRVCTIKLAKAGLMEAGPAGKINIEYKGLISALKKVK